MSRFQVLCVTMHQKDFAKIREMNIRSDVIFANQADTTAYDELQFDGHTAKMITTATRGVGINRNLTLMYADGEIGLFADDDVRYVDDAEQRILSEFDAHPDADIMVFNLETDSKERKQEQYRKTRRCPPWQRMPWGCFRIAMRLDSVKKANIWFTTLFGGGCAFPSGEDSMWLLDAKRKGLRFYISKEIIGKVSFDSSTWFTGYGHKFYYAKGAFYRAVHPKTFSMWMFYFAVRTRGLGSLSVREKLNWIRKGREGYQKGLSFEAYFDLERSRGL